MRKITRKHINIIASYESKLVLFFILLVIVLTFSQHKTNVYAASNVGDRTQVIQEALYNISLYQQTEVDSKLEPIVDSIKVDAQSYINSRISATRISITAFFAYQYVNANSDFNYYCIQLRSQTEYSLRYEKKKVREEIMKEVDNIINEEKQQLQSELIYLLIW